MKKFFAFFCTLALLSPFFLQAQDEDEYQLIPGDGGLAYSVKVDGSMFAMTATPDGNTLIVAVGDELLVLDFKTGALKKYLELDDLAEIYFEERNLEEPSIGYVRSMEVLPNGKAFVTGGIGGIFLIGLDDFAVRWYAPGHEDPMGVQQGSTPETSAYRVRATPDNQWIISSSQDDTKLQFWSVADGSQGTTIETGLEEAVEDIALSPDGSRLAVCNHHFLINMTTSGQQLWKLPGMFEGFLQFSPDNSKLAFSRWGSKATLCIGDTQTMATDEGRRKIIYHRSGERARTNTGIVWSIDNATLYTTGDGGTCPVLKHQLQAGSIQSTTIEADFETEIDADKTIVLGVNETLLAVAGSDDEIRVYKLK